MKITINDVISWEPCYTYTPSRLHELFAGRESLGPSDIARLDISMADKLWALRHFRTPIDHSVDDQLVEFACICVERIIALLKEHREYSPLVLRKAVNITRAYQRQEVTYSHLWCIWEEMRNNCISGTETYTYQQRRSLNALGYIVNMRSHELANRDNNSFISPVATEEVIAENYGIDDRPWQTEQLIKCMEAICKT